MRTRATICRSPVDKCDQPERLDNSLVVTEIFLTVESWKTRNCFLAMFPESGQNRKHCFLAMFPEGGQTRKHCFLAMFPNDG
jgi:hypothetical protein